MNTKRVVQTVLTEEEIKHLKELDIEALISRYPSSLIVSDDETVKALAQGVLLQKKRQILSRK